MNEQSDAQLLRAYAETHSEAAFGELVRRYLDLVYSAGRRMVCDPHLAEDVTQAVFIALAKTSAQLAGRPVLSSWLHRTARNIAAQTIRTIERRRAREQESAAMNELLSAEPDVSWEHIAPYLDDALGELSEPDRDAIFLRYFERKSAREMAATLGISDEAAKKRVTRAVEHLRELFAQRGVTLGASGLVVLISANAIQAAPAGLAITITAAVAVGGTTIVSTGTITTTKVIAMTTLQKTIVAATIVAAVGTSLYEARQASASRREVNIQQRQHAEQLQQLQNERDEATQQLAALRDENERLKQNPSELLKLRGEVAGLRQKSNELAAVRRLNQELRKASSASEKEQTPTPPPQKLQQEYYAREDLAFAGYAEPELTFKSITWAANQGNWEAMLNGMSPGTRADLEKELQSMPESVLASRKARMEHVKGYRLSDMTVRTDGKVAMQVATVYDDRNDVKEEMIFERSGKEWKVTK
jgi:RNA polymerase sigma factor (sigma-70 family)